MTDEGTAYAGPHPWHDCAFDISLFTTAPANKTDPRTLDTILFQPATTPTARCLAEIRDELAAHYGEGKADSSLLTFGLGEELEWRIPGANVSFVRKDKPPSFRLFYSELEIDAKSVGTLVRITNPAKSGITIYDVIERGPPPPDLTYTLAMAGAQAALQACRRAKIPAVVEVFGFNGEMRVLLQDDDIRSYDAAEHARDKAAAVFFTDRASRDYDKSLETKGQGKLAGSAFRSRSWPATKRLLDGEPMAKPGALPVVIGDHYVGVVSVDGGWDYAHNRDDEAWDGDEDCARAGVEAIRRQWRK